MNSSLSSSLLLADKHTQLHAVSKSADFPRIGILGGMGPLASAEFVVKLTRATPATRDQEHFPITLDSSPQIPDRPTAIDKNGEDPFPGMIEVLRRLEAADCALITMPCNTVHHWYDRLSKETHIPIVHIADGVGAQLRKIAPHAKKVGILGTTVTSKLGIYPNRLGNEWQWIFATENELNQVVMPAVFAVKGGDLDLGRELFLKSAQFLIDRQIDVLVLACTEIPIVLNQADFPIPIIDTTQALAEHTIACAQNIHRRNQMMLVK